MPSTDRNKKSVRFSLGTSEEQASAYFCPLIVSFNCTFGSINEDF